MNAAIVIPGQAPQYGYFADPAAGEKEQIVRVKAAAIHHVVKSIAAGKHYSAVAISHLFPVWTVSGCWQTAPGIISGCRT